MKLKYNDSLAFAHVILNLLLEYASIAVDEEMCAFIDENMEIVSWSNGREQGMAIWILCGTLPYNNKHIAFARERHSDRAMVISYHGYNSTTHLPDNDEEWDNNCRTFKTAAEAAAFIAIELITYVKNFKEKAQ